MTIKSEPPPVPIPRHRRRWRWRVVSVVSIFALIVGGLWFDDYLSRKAWTDACAEADRLDPGWRWDDLMAARPSEPSDNAAIRVHQIRTALPQRWPDWMAVVRP